MSKRKTIKITLDNEVIFRLELAGSDEVVDMLVSEFEYKWVLTRAIKTLVERKVGVGTEKQPQKDPK